MIRILTVFWIVVAVMVTGTRPVLGAPPRIDDCEAKARILAPAAGSTVSGIVQIEGTASLGDFVRYELAVAPNGTQAWGNIGQGQQPLVNGQLGVWDSASVGDGAYAIRLRVVDMTSNYCEAVVTGINVQNSRPTEVPTAVATPTPEETEAPPIQNAVPTPLPTTRSADETPTPEGTVTPPRPGPSRTPPPGSGGIGGIEIEQVIEAVTDFFAALGRVFLFGAVAMAGIFIVVGVVYFVRRVL
jgi:hypothetical protein